MNTQTDKLKDSKSIIADSNELLKKINDDINEKLEKLKSFGEKVKLDITNFNKEKIKLENENKSKVKKLF